MSYDGKLIGMLEAKDYRSVDMIFPLLVCFLTAVAVNIFLLHALTYL